MEEPPFDDLVTFETDPLARVLRELWSRLHESDAQNTKLSMRLEEALGRISALEKEKEESRAVVSKIENLSSLLNDSNARFAELDTRLKAVEETTQKQDFGSDIAGLNEKLMAFARDIASLRTKLGAKDPAPTVPASSHDLSDLATRIDQALSAVASLGDRIDHLTLDDLVAQKAHHDHVVYEDDSGHVEHYERRDSVQQEALTQGLDGLSLHQGKGGSPSRSATPDHSDNEVPPSSSPRAFIQPAVGDGFETTSDPHGPTEVRVPGPPPPSSQGRPVRASPRVQPPSPTQLERVTPSQQGSQTELLHGYKNLNHLVNEHTRLIEQLMRGRSSLGADDDKLDRKTADELFAAINDKLRQLAEVSNRNVDVLGRMCNGKADAEALAVVEAELAALLSDDASAAAGKIHFRCLCCDRVRSSMEGASTPAFRAASAQGNHSFSVKELQFIHSGSVPPDRRVPLYGTDTRVYRGGSPRGTREEYMRESVEVARTTANMRAARPASAPPSARSRISRRATNTRTRGVPARKVRNA